MSGALQGDLGELERLPGTDGEVNSHRAAPVVPGDHELRPAGLTVQQAPPFPISV